MNTRSPFRALLKTNLVMMIGIFLCAYFTYHAVQGQRSYPRLSEVRSNILELEQTRAALIQEREALEIKVVMLRPGSIHKDLLEERVRDVLGYQYPGELSLVGQVLQ